MATSPDVRGHTRFWIIQRILATVAAAPWVYLLWSGYDLCFGKRAVPPNQQQLQFYVYEPAAGLAVSIIFVIVARRVPPAVAWVVCVILLLIVLWLISMWGGGI